MGYPDRVGFFGFLFPAKNNLPGTKVSPHVVRRRRRCRRCR